MLEEDVLSELRVDDDLSCHSSGKLLEKVEEEPVEPHASIVSLGGKELVRKVAVEQHLFALHSEQGNWEADLVKHEIVELFP